LLCAVRSGGNSSRKAPRGEDWQLSSRISLPSWSMQITYVVRASRPQVAIPWRPLPHAANACRVVYLALQLLVISPSDSEFVPYRLVPVNNLHGVYGCSM
jgi:hypothetical protein